MTALAVVLAVPLLSGCRRASSPVVYTGGTHPMEPGNGWGLWNISWQRWQSYSALR